MFEIGENIIYGNTGICKVEDITHPQMEGADKEKLYYLLVPLNEKKSKIYTPTDNNKILMRRVLTKQEAEELVVDITNIEGIEYSSADKTREEKYKAILKTCDCHEWIKMIKTLYFRKKDLMSKGKKLSNTDEKYLRKAEDNLYTELSFALDIDKSGVVEYIENRVEGK